MRVFWLQQSDADVPGENGWLTSTELLRMNGMRTPKRRGDWRLGRWTAKQAVSAYFGWSNDHNTLAAIEIQTATSGAPEVCITARPAPVAISISHRAGLAICALAPSGFALGCDLELMESRSDVFIVDYFTAEEQLLLRQTPRSHQTLLVNLLWSAKESALKALQEGLRLDTRSVVVRLERRLTENGDERSSNSSADPQTSRSWNWHPLHVACSRGFEFTGWYQYAGQFVRTIVAPELEMQPTLLDLALNRERTKLNINAESTPLAARRFVPGERYPDLPTNDDHLFARTS